VQSINVKPKVVSPYDLARHESLSSSVVTAPDRCTEGHVFDSRRGLRFFALSHARDKLNIPSLFFIHYYYFFIELQRHSQHLNNLTTLTTYILHCRYYYDYYYVSNTYF